MQRNYQVGRSIISTMLCVVLFAFITKAVWLAGTVTSFPEFISGLFTIDVAFWIALLATFVAVCVFFFIACMLGALVREACSCCFEP